MTMPEARDQLIDAVAKLTELTQNGQLQWAVDEFFEAPGAASPAYTVEYKGRRLRLQKRQSKEESPFDFGRSVVIDQHVLEFVGSSGSRLWVFPETDAIKDLFTAVQYQTAGVKGFLSDLFSEGSN
jgi:hypothetical protein